jgi:two-component system, cell cycle sensor histidine kinase and response regulator CckA
MSPSAPSIPQPLFPISRRKAKAAVLGLFSLTALIWLSPRSLLAANFLPHWYCYLGNQRLLWSNVIADLVIGFSYLAISAILVWLVRRAGRDLPYPYFFWAFGVFIVSCGATHFMEVLTVWKPFYWLSAAVKIVTAAASAGTAAVLLLAADDIVDFVRTSREAAARRGNEQFRALVNAAPMAVISADTSGKITAWNPAAERTFGLPASEAVGTVLSSLVPPEKLEEQAALRRRTLAGESITGFETVHLDRTGSAFPVSISTAPLADGSGTVTGLVGVIEDIRERKRLESQVRQSQKMEVLGRLAGGVAHDFNNMLMVLGGCAELLDRSLSRESPARLYLDQIQRTTEKAAAITKQLLTFSRKQVLEILPMDLHESLSESEFMLPRLLGSDIELTFHHGAVKSWILSAPNQIEQVIANLAVNARDAMPEGGHLAISTRNANILPEDGADSPALPGDWVVLEVCDTGTGIDEETRAQLFEPFFTTKPAGKGTGLGLATVYGIVKQSHGHIRVMSTPGKGARFQVYFPLVEAAVPKAPDSPPVETTEDAGGGATILVADDEAALRHAVVEILRSSGYKVFEAQTAPDALQIAEQHGGELDILLTDIVMPVLRGPELARCVTKIHPHIRVVYMSGYAEGFPDSELPINSVFLQKPFRFATLLEQLKLVRRRA